MLRLRYGCALSLLVLAAGACSSAGGKPAGPPVPPVTLAADAAPEPVAAAKPPACPDAATLETRLEQRWKPAPAKVQIVSCMPGAFGRAGWLVVAYVDTFGPDDDPDMPSDSSVRRIVLDADSVIAEGEPESVAPWYRYEGGGPGDSSLVDFDGDGIAEILETHSASHGGTSYDTLVVRRVASPAIREIWSEDIGYNNLTGESDELVDWSSTAEVEPIPDSRGHALVITTTWSEGTPSGDQDELAPGKHVYRLSGDTFSEQGK